MSVKVVSFNDSQNLEENDFNDNGKIESIELHFEDIENNDYDDNDDYESSYVMPKPILKKTNPKIKRNPNSVSYDDILNSLGFGVNNMGLYRKKNTEIQEYHQPNYPNPNYPNPNYPNRGQNNTFTNNPLQHSQTNYLPLDPQVKNSAIYNKYFKNYKDPNEIKMPQVPLTPQEQRVKLIKQYVEAQQAKKRIAQIKSKKMFYSTQNIAISAPQQQAPNNLNKLFMFSNRK